MNNVEIKAMSISEIVNKFASVEDFIRAAEIASADIDDDNEYVAFARWIRVRAADVTPAFNAKARLLEARAAWNEAQADASGDEIAIGRRFVAGERMRVAAEDLRVHIHG